MTNVAATALVVDDAAAAAVAAVDVVVVDDAAAAGVAAVDVVVVVDDAAAAAAVANWIRNIHSNFELFFCAKPIFWGSVAKTLRFLHSSLFVLNQFIKSALSNINQIT